MLAVRVIPCLLLKGRGLVKTVKFRNAKYIGDPINAVKIFNEKEVDEIIVLDITATMEQRKPSMRVISEIASECFMPLCYGGGIRALGDIKAIFNLGVEKVGINTYACENPHFVKEAAEVFGSQSIVVSIDVKRNVSGNYEVYTHGGTKATSLDPVCFVREMETMGAGEIFLNSIDRDGTMQGYDIELIRKVSSAVSVPVVACGGAAGVESLAEAVRQGGASAVSAGSMFVFHGRHRAVLINFPTSEELQQAFGRGC